MGFHGPYVMIFSRSGIPTSSGIDTSFFADLGLTGYVGPSGRGVVKGTASGVSTSLPIVVYWYNGNYQNWPLLRHSQVVGLKPQSTAMPALSLLRRQQLIVEV